MSIAMHNNVESDSPPAAHAAHAAHATVATQNQHPLTNVSPSAINKWRWPRLDIRATPVRGRLPAPFVFCVLTLALLCVAIFAVGYGAYRIPSAQVISGLLQMTGLEIAAWPAPDAGQYAVLSSVRLPRVLLGLLIGAALAVAGAVIQGLFRNPLADPGLIGIAGGAAVAVASVIVLGATLFAGLTAVLGPWTLPVAGFVGGAIATALTYFLSQREGRTSLTTMLLAGIAVNAIAGALIGVFSYLATDEQLRNITFWTFGSLGGATWEMLAAISIPIALTIFWMWRLAPLLTALMFGEREAGHLGISVQTMKRSVILGAALLTGFSVAVSGVIGFVALVAPHIARLLLGPDLRLVVPASALFGATLLMLADLFARTAVAPAALPVGVVTAIIGAPLFLLLLAKQRGQISD
jgi:iron complex transport system permease protein